MYQNYNYIPNQSQRQGQALISLKGRPVTSIDEVRAMPVDFDGSVFFFPDLANKRIYTKQINMDGTASLFMYELKEIPVESPQMLANTDNFITRNEFEQALEQIRNLISVPKEVDKIKNEYQF